MRSAIDDQIKIGKSYLAKKQFANAIKVANEIIRTRRNDPRGWLLLSEINLAAGQFVYALDNALQSVKLEPSRVSSLAQLARCYMMVQQKQQACEVAEKAASLNPQDAETLDALAATLTLCDEQELALPLAEKAVEQNPDNSWYLYNLATIQRMLGMVDEAENNCDRAIENNPDDYRAYHVRSDLRKQTPERNHIKQIEIRLDAGIAPWRGEMMLNFALAKEQEDIEDYENSFLHLKRACDLQRKHIEYRVNDDIATINEIISRHTLDAFNSLRPGYEGEEPIFIVGLPRTGTTLMERIISSHSNVFAAGELQNFATELVKAVQGNANKQRIGKTDLVDQSLNIDMSELGRAYLESTRPATGNTARFIDKLPMNYLYCGLIHAALPGAKIISLNRNPMDSCYSIYKMMFQSAYPFSYDLNDLGNYYIAWRKLMQHWQEVLGDALLIVDYENLVAYPEEISRKLIDYCDLDWEDACLEFYKSDSASTTASAVQIRQPVYKSSVGRWKKYQTQLQTLIEMFEADGIDIGI